MITLERQPNRGGSVDTYVLTQKINNMGEGGEDRLELLKNIHLLLQMVGGFSQGIFALLTPENTTRMPEEEMRKVFTLYKDLTLRLVGHNLSLQAEILKKAERHITGDLAV